MKIENLSVSEYRKFGLSFGAVIAFVFGVFFPWVFNANFLVWPWVLATILVLWALVSPGSLKFVYIPWMHFALVLGFINTRIILGVIFFLIFMPISFIFKMFSIDPLKRKVYDGSLDTYWMNSDKPEKNQMENVY